MRHPAVPTAPPSPLRIAALSTAMAANLAAVIGLTLMQMASPPQAAKPEPPPLQFDIITRAPPPPPAPPMPRTPERPAPREVAPPVVQPPAPAPVESAWQTDTVVAPPAAVPVPVESGAPPATAGSGNGARVGLRYIEAPPPRYPPFARRRGLQGEVILRVHVGTDGRPRSVEVEEGSGHALLDREARAHVLARWRFEPAQVDGQLVEAWGLVPIRFALH